MTEPQFYVEGDRDNNPTIMEHAIPGADHVVANLHSGFGLHIEPAYDDLAFAVLARVLAPDEATVERVARAMHASWCNCGGGDSTTIDDRQQARAALAALAEDPAEVSP